MHNESGNYLSSMQHQARIQEPVQVGAITFGNKTFSEFGTKLFQNSEQNFAKKGIKLFQKRNITFPNKEQNFSKKRTKLFQIRNKTFPKKEQNFSTKGTSEHLLTYLCSFLSSFRSNFCYFFKQISQSF